jgi:uncharacterized membrane protein YdjX (TVP38/TMEM64 family)
MISQFLTVLRNANPKIWLQGFVLIGLLIAAGYLLKSVDLDAFFKSLPFTQDINRKWYYGPIGFTIFSILAICLSCPRQVVSFFAAYFFGLWEGFFTAWFSVSVACFFTFLFAQVFQHRVKRFVKGRIGIAVQFWRENVFLATMIWRFLPAGSNLITNLAAGALGIPATGFMIGSAIGYIPQTFIFALIGSGVKVESGTQVLVSIGLFAVSIILSVFLYARYKKRIRLEK